MANPDKGQWGLQRRMLFGAVAGLAFKAKFGENAAAASEYGVLDSDIGNLVGVKDGDTLWGIAQKNGTTVPALVRANPKITNPNLIHAGDVFLIPYERKTGWEKPLVQTVTMAYERKPAKNPVIVAFEALGEPFINSGMWGGVVPGGEARQRIYMRGLTPDLPEPGKINMVGRGYFYPLETKDYEVIGKGAVSRGVGQMTSIEVGPTNIPVSGEAEVVAVDARVQPVATSFRFDSQEGQALVRKALTDNRTLLLDVDERKQARSVRIVTS